MPLHSYAKFDFEEVLTQDGMTVESQGAQYMEADDGVETAPTAEETIVYEFEYGAEVPVNPQTGATAGSTVVYPLRIVKPLDSSSPLLFEKMKGGIMGTVEIRSMRTGTAGPEHYMTLTFEEAQIVGIKAYQPNTLDETKAAYPDCEEVKFTYTKFTVEQVKASKMGSGSSR